MADIHVSAGTSQAALQAIINGAPAGSVIILANGSYALTSTLYVSNSVTLQGESEAGVTIDASALNNGNGYAILVNADNATLSTFTLLGGGGGAGETARGIKVEPNTVTITDRVTGVSIQDVTVNDFRVAEIDVNGADNLTLSNVTVDGMSTQGAGIALTDVNGAVLNNIDVSNNLWGGVAIYSGGYYASGSNGSHDITFTGTFAGPLANQAQPILVQAKGGYPADGNTLPNNFDYAVYNSQFRPDGSQFLSFFGSAADAAAFALAIQVAPNTLTPNTASVIYQNAAADGADFVQGNIVVFPGMNLAAAYAAAAPGQVVHVIGTDSLDPADNYTGRVNAPDWFTGNQGDDVFNGAGGTGVDRFVFDQVNYNQVAVSKFGGSINLTSIEGADSVSGIEQIQFADGEVFDVVGTNIIVNTIDDENDATEDGATVTGAVFANDHDVDGSTLTTVAQTTDGTYGTLTLDALGNYSYTANNADELAEGEEDTDVFTYTVSDNGVLRSETITITVTGTNDLPMITTNDVEGGVFAEGDLDTFVGATWNSTALKTISPEANYKPTPAILAALQGLLGTSGAAGTAVGPVLDLIEADLAASGGTRADAILAVWDFLDNFYTSGATSVTYYYHVGHNTAAIRLGIEYADWLQAGNAPLTNAIVKYTENVGGAVTREQSLHNNLLGNFSEGTLDDRFTGGGVVPPGTDLEDTAIYAEIDAADLLDLLGRPVVSGNIPGNPAVVAQAAAIDQALGLVPAASGQLAADDVDNADLTWSVLDTNGDSQTSLDGAYGTLTVDADGAWRYVLDADLAKALAEGDDEVETFTVQVDDGDGGTDTTTISVTVTGANDAPTAVTLITGDQSVDEDDLFEFEVPADAFADADGTTPTLTATLADGSDLPPWLSFDGTTFSGTPTNDRVGMISVKVTATDDKGATASQTFDLTVDNTNDGPTFDFHQGFESDRDGVFDTTTPGWSSYGTVEVVTSHGAITAADGAQFAVLKEPLPINANSGPFSRLGGYRDLFVDGATAETKVYLDTSWAEGEGFTFSVATNGSNGLHRRDFSFTVAQTADGLEVGVGNGIDHNGPMPADIAGTDNVIEDSGWYTLQHVFNNVGGVLSVTFNVLDSLGNVVFTDVLSDPSDVIGLIGGNRYAWYGRIAVEDGIAVDDIALYGVDSGEADEGDAGVSLTGQVLFDDADGETIADLDVSPGPGLYVGMFNASISEDSTGASGGTITWTFEAAASEIDYLAEGDTLIQTYTLTIEDAAGETATKVVTVTVTGTNDVPVATAEYIDANEGDANFTGQLVATDADAVHTLTYTLDAPVNGLMLDTDGSYELDLSHADYVGLSFGETVDVTASYTVTDDKGATSTSTISITVTGTNEIPVVGAVNVDVNEGAGTVELDALADATDADGDHLVVLTPTAPLPAGVSFIGAGLTIDFEDYNLGAIITQGWTDDTPTSPAQAIVDVGGNKMLQLANDPQSGDFTGPYSPIVSVSAGESSVADVDQIEYSFQFKAVAGYADGSRLEIDIANAQGTDRNNFMALEYFGGGSLRLVQSSPAVGGGFTQTTLADNIDPSVFHTIRAVVRYVDGVDNDTVDYYLDGVHVGTGSTFENYGDVFHPAHDGIYATNRMLFRAGNVDTGLPADGPGGNRQGFYIDDINIATSNSDGPHFAFDANDPAYDHLKAGATQVVSFDYEVSDGIATTTQTATFTVTGTNDAPVAEDADFETDEDDATVTGQLVANDVDDDAMLTFSTVDTAAGFTLNPNGSYSFNPAHADYQSLAEGEELEIEIDYEVEDEHNATHQGKLTITVVGTNDAPFVIAIDSNLTGSATEPTSPGTVGAGGFIVADDDGGAAFLTFSTTTPTSDYGTFAIDATSGEWSFILGTGDAVQALGNGDFVDVSFTVVVSDGDLETTQTVVIRVNGANEVVTPTPGNPITVGTGYADTITGTTDDDFIYAGLGNDIVNAGDGDDSLFGQGGNDTIDAGLGDDKVDGGQGNDTIHGGSGDDNILGGSNDDKLYGEDDDDRLDGGSGADELFGGAGSDTLLGGSGDDKLTGGAGKDILTGNGGIDFFAFTNVTDSVIGNQRDVITDFVRGEDKIDLRALDINLGTGAIDQFVFVGEGPANLQASAGQLKYYHAGGNTIVAGRTFGSPDGRVDFQIQLSGELELTKEDFLGLAAGSGDTGTIADETFFSGAGRNTFIGGGGNDTFVISNADQSKYHNNPVWDIITDWADGDKVDLRGLDANATTPTDDAYSTALYGTATRNVTLGQIKIFEQGGSTFVVADTTGDTLADIKIEIHGTGLALDSGDFLL